MEFEEASVLAERVATIKTRVCKEELEWVSGSWQCHVITYIKFVFKSSCF